MELSVGKKVEHAYTKEYLWVLKIEKEKVLCRTKDLREIWFYPHELAEVSNLKESKGSKRFL